MSDGSGPNPRTAVDLSPMGWRQWFAIGITTALNALDGIDVLSVSYAAPGIARDWSLGPATIGWILSMELLGMALGSIVLGGVADRLGRRTTILASLVIMAVGMLGASHAAGVNELLSWRLLTGLGIGGMLPAINAVASELANNRWRNLAMSLMVIGYPLGGALGGLAVQRLYASGGTWRTVFEAGALLTVIFVPIVALLLVEPPAWLDKRKGLAAANRALHRLGLPAAETPSGPAEVRQVPLVAIFSPELRAATLTVTAAYFLHVTSFYFMIKWTPKIIAGLGYLPAQAAQTLALANVGGALGGTLLGLLALRFSVKRLTTLTLVETFCAVGAMGLVPVRLDTLGALVFAAGFFGNAGIGGLYLLFADVFPTPMRGTGAGFAIGVGRGGAVIAPVLAGYLFSAGLNLSWVALALGTGSILAALLLANLRGANNPIQQGTIA